jgi:hypothetical protein
MKNILKSALLTLAFSFGSTHAAVNTYTTESSFLSALIGPAITGVFDPIPDSPYYDVFSSVTKAGVTFTGNGTLYIFDPVSQGAYSAPFLSAQAGSPDNTMTAVHAGTTAIGFLYGDYITSGAALTATLSTGDVVVLPVANGTLKFVGFTSATPITSVLFTQSSINTMSFDVTKVYTGTALPVPEPSAYAMFGAGLALFGMIGRRRSRKQ